VNVPIDDRHPPDPELGLGVAGRDRVRRLLSWKTVTDATIAAYREALA